MADLIERLRGPCPGIPVMQDAADEIERLYKWQREMVEKMAGGGRLDGYRELADKLAEQAAEIERLTTALKIANANHEHFERHWYLRGDEIERLRAERDEYREAARTWENEAERRSRRYEACVDERDKLHDVLLSWDALIAYQFTGSRDAMDALHQCAQDTQAVLGSEG